MYFGGAMVFTSAYGSTLPRMLCPRPRSWPYAPVEKLHAPTIRIINDANVLSVTPPETRLDNSLPPAARVNVVTAEGGQIDAGEFWR